MSIRESYMLALARRSYRRNLEQIDVDELDEIVSTDDSIPGSSESRAGNELSATGVPDRPATTRGGLEDRRSAIPPHVSGVPSS